MNGFWGSEIETEGYQKKNKNEEEELTSLDPRLAMIDTRDHLASGLYRVMTSTMELILIVSKTARPFKALVSRSGGISSYEAHYGLTITS